MNREGPKKSEDRVAVVVDSAASLPLDAPAHQGLYVVPMQLSIRGRTYLDGLDLTPAAFYRMQRGMEVLPTTSAPSPAMFLDAFRSAAQGASSILCLTVSPRFSSSYDSARNAAMMARETLPIIPIEVLDTESAAGGEGLVATEAWRAADCGASLDEVVDAARRVVSKVSLLAFLDTLYYVWRSGRVPRVAYMATSILRVKLLLELSHGEVRNIARHRTLHRATDRVIQLMRVRVAQGPVHGAVMYGDAEDAAEHLRERVKAEFVCDELFVSQFSPVMGAHTGPGLLGVAFWSEATAE